MENGYKVLWTDNALIELTSTYEYLENNFTDKELNKLSKEIEKVTFLISKNPLLFPEAEEMKGIRRAVVLKFNTMNYRIQILKQYRDYLFFQIDKIQL